MSFYDKSEEYQKRGIDIDLYDAIECNDPSFTIEDIKQVCAVVEGENDGAAWHWIIQKHDGNFFYFAGSCDYTGWDCQSSVWEGADYSTWQNALNDIYGGYHTYTDKMELDAVYADLFGQMMNTKHRTWHEETTPTFTEHYGVDLSQVKQPIRIADTMTPSVRGDYEVLTLDSHTALKAMVELWSEGAWFCHRPIEGDDTTTDCELVLKTSDLWMISNL